MYVFAEVSRRNQSCNTASQQATTQETPALVYTRGQTITHLFFSHRLLLMMSLDPANLLVTDAVGREGMSVGACARDSREADTGRRFFISDSLF